MPARRRSFLANAVRELSLPTERIGLACPRRPGAGGPAVEDRAWTTSKATGAASAPLQAATGRDPVRTVGAAVHPEWPPHGRTARLTVCDDLSWLPARGLEPVARTGRTRPPEREVHREVRITLPGSTGIGEAR